MALKKAEQRYAVQVSDTTMLDYVLWLVNKKNYSIVGRIGFVFKA